MTVLTRISALAARVFTASERRVARQTFWANAIAAVRLLGGIAAVYMAARILGVDGFGALAFISALCALAHGRASALAWRRKGWSGSVRRRPTGRFIGASLAGSAAGRAWTPAEPRSYRAGGWRDIPSCVDIAPFADALRSGARIRRASGIGYILRPPRGGASRSRTGALAAAALDGLASKPPSSCIMVWREKLAPRWGAMTA